MKRFDTVRRKLDPTFTGTVLLDPQGGVVYVRVDTWGKTRRTRDGIVGLGVDLLEVVSAGVAQLAEQLPCKQRVAGSMPAASLE